MHTRISAAMGRPTALATGYLALLLLVSYQATGSLDWQSRAALLAVELAALPLSLWLRAGIRRSIQEGVKHASSRDELTGLGSRAFFMERLQEALSRSRRSGVPVAVLFLDLDHFKRLNDTLGHPAGDKMLIEAARRMERVVRAGEACARLGGDEFTFLLEGLKRPEGAEAMASRILGQFEKPFMIEGHEVLMSASLGIAVSGPSSGPAEELLRRADVALYRAKAEGRNCWRVFDGHGRTQSVEGLEVGARLRNAVEQNELRLYFQPEVNLKDGEVSGFEALVRWQHPQRGLLSPLEFIPSAEESGFIHAIGKWVLSAACIETVELQKRFPGASRASVSVNVSPLEFGSRRFVADVAETLQRSGLDPHFLVLEITETALMQDVDAALETLYGLKQLGVRLAIDDFGTGYSSLSQLRKFPADILKIDQSFVRELERDPKVRAIVQATVVLAHTLGMDVVAEGVETPQQLDYLVDAECDRAQGYLFARPLAPAAIGGFILRNQEPPRLEALTVAPAT
jgi:diguanylate cyclase (GGDEF)-like protein